MKIGVSNIAWPAPFDATAADLLIRLGVGGVELAPTRIWPDLSTVSARDASAYRALWEHRGLTVIATQAVLFGRPDLTIFRTVAARKATSDYLCAVLDLAARLGAGSVVFGSPRNRARGDVPESEATVIAVEFFGNLARVALGVGTTLVIEANPPDYGADFVTRARDAARLVRAVDSDGFRLHLDAACMHLAGDDPAEEVPIAADILGHVHVSEPDLAAVGTGPVHHAAFASCLRRIDYSGWCSLEMRGGDTLDPVTLERSVRFAQRLYA